jgi:alpha-ribazole phosphatase
MMRLLLARHASTEWNGEGRFQGHQDIPLGATGRSQALCLAGRLTAERLDRIYTSDLRRASATARGVGNACGVPLTTDARLRELHFGAWEGLTYSELQERHADALTAWEADPLRMAPPGGETLAQLAERIGVFLAGISRATERDHNVLVVGHKGSLQVLLCLALGLSPSHRWKFCLEPASLSELHVFSEQALLVRLNDVHHLREAVHAG